MAYDFTKVPEKCPKCGSEEIESQLGDGMRTMEKRNMTKTKKNADGAHLHNPRYVCSGCAAIYEDDKFMGHLPPED